MLFGISVYSFGDGDSQVKPVAALVEELATSGIPYRTHAMQTVAEGEWEQVMPVLQEAYRAMTEKYGRVYMNVTMDQHGDLPNRLDGAVEDVEKELGHPLAR